MQKQNRVIVISFADEFTDEYDHVQNMKINKENISKFVCEAIREKVNSQTGNSNIKVDNYNIAEFDKRLKMLEEEIKKKPETKVVYIQKDKENLSQNTKEEKIDEILIQTAGGFDF